MEEIDVDEALFLELPRQPGHVGVAEARLAAELVELQAAPGADAQRQADQPVHFLRGERAGETGADGGLEVLAPGAAEPAEPKRDGQGLGRGDGRRHLLLEQLVAAL